MKDRCGKHHRNLKLSFLTLFSLFSILLELKSEILAKIALICAIEDIPNPNYLRKKKFSSGKPLF